MQSSMLSSGRRMENLCLVCGDKASGRHYGVPSCDGCRGFFKRSIRRNLDYICKESNGCIVDVSRRNQCQACRFRRCLEVNMKRDAVQHERAPRGALKRVYPAELLANTPLMPPSSLGVGHFYGGSFAFPWRPTMGNLLQVPPHFPLNVLAPTPASVASVASGSASGNQVKEDEVSSSANEDAGSRRESEVVEASKKVEKSAAANLNVGPLELGDGSGDSNEAAARLLFLTVRWTRTIPSFSHLTYRDQILLLEETWHELFVLTVAQWGLNLEEVAVLGSERERNGGREGSLRDLQQLRELVARLHLFRLDHTEYAFLKALVLFKPDTAGLRNSAAIEMLQDQTQMMLQEYCTAPAQSFAANVTSRHSMLSSRFGKLLLLLPAFRSVRDASVRHLFFRQLIGDVPITRLLADVMGTF